MLLTTAYGQRHCCPEIWNLVSEICDLIGGTAAHRVVHRGAEVVLTIFSLLGSARCLTAHLAICLLPISPLVELT